MIALVSLGAAAAAGLLLTIVRPAGAREPRGAPGRALLLLALTAVGPVVVSVPVTTLILAGVAGATAWAATALLARRRRLLAARRRSAQVLLACESLSGDLGVGLAQRVALERVAHQWPEFAPVAAAARLDADVPAELRRIADLPGAGELASLAAAWQVAQLSGAGLAPTLAAITRVVRAEAGTTRLVESELAASRATASLLIALPAGVLLLGEGIGARPWQFLTGSVFGIGCVVVGVMLDLVGLWWLQRIATRVLRS